MGSLLPLYGMNNASEEMVHCFRTFFLLFYYFCARFLEVLVLWHHPKR